MVHGTEAATPMKARANGIALVTLIALISTARAENPFGQIASQGVQPIQALAMVAATMVAIALLREFAPKAAKRA